MAFLSSLKKESFAILVLLFVSSDLFDGIHGLGIGNQHKTNKLLVVSHELCQSCPREASSLKGVRTYSELKYDSRVSLPCSFTICISNIVTTNNPAKDLFTLLGDDGQ